MAIPRYDDSQREGGTTINVPKKDPQVIVMLNDSNNVLVDLLDRLQELESRLAKVLRPTTELNDNQKPEEPQIVPLARELMSHRDKLQIAKNTVIDIINRFEL